MKNLITLLIILLSTIGYSQITTSNLEKELFKTINTHKLSLGKPQNNVDVVTCDKTVGHFVGKSEAY